MEKSFETSFHFMRHQRNLCFSSDFKVQLIERNRVDYKSEEAFEQAQPRSEKTPRATHHDAFVGRFRNRKCTHIGSIYGI